MMPYSVPYYPIPQPSAAYPPASGTPGAARAGHHVHFESYGEHNQPGQRGPPLMPLVTPYDTWAMPPGGYYGPGYMHSRPIRRQSRKETRRSASPTPASSPSGLKAKRRHKNVKFEQESDDDVLEKVAEYSPPPLRSYEPPTEALSHGTEDHSSNGETSDESRSSSSEEGTRRRRRGASTIRSYASSRYRATPALVTEESGSSAYSFAASFRAARAASIGGSADWEQSEDPDATPSQPSPKDDQNPEVAHILASSYTGQGYAVAEGHHSADLLMAANPAQLRHLQPLYRWM